MRKIEVSEQLEVKPEIVWKYISNIRTYPKFVDFQKRVVRVDDFKVGGRWSDVSTVLFFPQQVNHEIIEIVNGKKVVYLIKLPFGGKIIQTVEALSYEKGCKFTLGAEIDLGSKIVDMLIGSILEFRTRKMFLRTAENIKRIAAKGEYQ